jgi:hypothetical protein
MASTTFAAILMPEDSGFGSLLSELGSLVEATFPEDTGVTIRPPII